MRRRKRPEEHADHEKWAIPYADLLTLLLAFFVVMYSLSQINESKYRVLAESINEAFTGTGRVVEPHAPTQPARQVPQADEQRAASAAPIALIDVPLPPRNLPLPGHEGAADDASFGEREQRLQRDAIALDHIGSDDSGDNADLAALETISNDIARALEPWVESEQVIIRQTQLWLEIEIRTDVLFASGFAELNPGARGVLDDVADVLARFPNAVRIEGYTDDRPIETVRFPSNWELSAARAGSVARLFGSRGIDPTRLGIFGWGEHHPIAGNDTPEGRNQNRRIAIVVLSERGAAMPAFRAEQPKLAGHAPAVAEEPGTPFTARDETRIAPTTVTPLGSPR